MLVLDTNTQRQLIVITLLDGDLETKDFKRLREQFNAFVNHQDVIPGLVIHAQEFPEWEDFEAFKAHMQFIRDHEHLLKRVALVTDSAGIMLIQPLADFFVEAQLRRFKNDELEAAKTWAATGEEPVRPPAVHKIEGLPRDVVALKFTGNVTADDYKNTLTPLIEAGMKEHDKLKLLAVFADDFDSYSVGAVWDDLMLGLKHWGDFSSIALVTDHDWLRHATRFFGALMPADIMVFDDDELESAKAWIRAAK